MSRAAFPHLVERAPSSIVNIGSIAGAEPGPGHVHYSVAKAGVHHMTKVLAYEWGSHGIRVNCIAPGVIETPKSAFAGNEEKKQSWILRVPMRSLGRPLDIVGATILLASDASAYINGTIIRIDGGPRSGTAFG
jgi:NAD(P)-dependent dehydrogenase (short-subunit alcohol dehydrogenase family)